MIDLQEVCCLNKGGDFIYGLFDLAPFLVIEMLDSYDVSFGNDERVAWTYRVIIKDREKRITLPNDLILLLLYIA